MMPFNPWLGVGTSAYGMPAGKPTPSPTSPQDISWQPSPEELASFGEFAGPPRPADDDLAAAQASIEAMATEKAVRDTAKDAPRGTFGAEEQRIAAKFSRPASSVQELINRLNERELKSLEQQGLTVEGLKKSLGELERKDLPMDLTGLAALIDTWTGSNFAQSYRPPETARDRQGAVEKLRGQIAQSEQGLSENEIGLLRSQLNNAFQVENLDETKAHRKDQMALAREQLGLERDKLNQKDSAYTPFEKKTDEEAAKELTDFNVAGGFAATEKNIVAMKEAISALENDKEGRLTGVDIGAANAVGGLSLYSRDAAALKQKLDQIAQADIKTTLGAQFTQAEGEGILARAYDPSLGNAANLEKLRSALSKMEANYRAKKTAAEYGRAYGTMRGYQGGVGSAPTQSAKKEKGQRVYSPSRNKTKIFYEDGTEELVHGDQRK
jgi:hypothetical protein